MTDQKSRRAPRRGRARQRAIRAHAARTGVAYSVAARQLESLGLHPHETVASYGRTIYPNRAIAEARLSRTVEQRLADTRGAALLPSGRAAHLVARFPAYDSPAGPLYDGAGREDLLAMLYAVVSSGSDPVAAQLAWAAETGEETAVDMECVPFDREARVLLERDAVTLRAVLVHGLAHGLAAGAQSRQEAARLRDVDPPPPGAVEGARQILDAVLMVAKDGHAPGTRVRVAVSPYEGRVATIVGAVWGVSGPPVAYRIRLDEPEVTVTAGPGELVVLADQECQPA